MSTTDAPKGPAQAPPTVAPKAAAPEAAAPAGGVTSSMMQKKLARRRKEQGGEDAAGGGKPAAAGAGDGGGGGGSEAGAPESGSEPLLTGKDPAAIAQHAFSGTPIPLPHRAQLEHGFGRSLAGVEAHADGAAKAATRALGAEAFTFGNKIAFSSSSPAIELTAHEVAHTIQQGGAGPASGATSVGGTGGAHETEADQAATIVAAGGTAKVAQSASAHIQMRTFREYCAELKNGAIVMRDWAGLFDQLTTFDFDWANGAARCPALDVGTAYRYFGHYLPASYGQMLSPAGKDTVSVEISIAMDPQVTISARRLETTTFSYGSAATGMMSSGSAALNGVTISATLKSRIAHAHINNAVAYNPSFIQGSQVASASEVDFDALDVVATDAGSIFGQASVKAINVGGLKYPNQPPVNFSLHGASASMLGLPKMLASAPAAPGAPAGPKAMPTAPAVLPPNTSVNILIEGVRAAAATTATAQAAGGGVAHFKLQLMQGASELAGFEVWGFHAGGSDKAGGVGYGTIDRLQIRGAPNLIPTLLQSPAIAAQPQIAQAIDVVHKAGVEPTVGGSLDITNVGVTDNAGAVTASTDLRIALTDPGVGDLTVALVGFSGKADTGTKTGGASFKSFDASLKASDGSTAAVSIGGTAPTAVTADGKGIATTPIAFHVTGSTGDVSKLFASVRRHVKSMPPAVDAALTTVQGIGADASGTLSATVGKDGTATVKANFSATVTADGIGALTVDLRGFTGQNGGKANMSFEHFGASLKSPPAKVGEAEELASFSIDNTTATAEHTTSTFTATGKPSKVIDAVRAHFAQLIPAEAKAAFAMVHDYAMGATVSGDIVSTTKGTHTNVVGNIHAEADAADGSHLTLDMTDVSGNSDKDAMDVTFKQFTANLDPPGGGHNGALAKISIMGGAGETHGAGAAKTVDASAKKVEASGASANLGVLVETMRTQVAKLPPAMNQVVLLAERNAVKAGGSVAMSNVKLTEKGANVEASGDIDLKFQAGQVGEVHLNLVGFHGVSGGSSLAGGSFTKFTGALTGKDGKSKIASFECDGMSNAHVDPGAKGDLGFKLKNLVVTGSGANFDALINGVQKEFQKLPPQILSAFNTIRSYGIKDVGGSVGMTDLAVDKKGNTTTATARTFATHLVVDGVGRIELSVDGFQGTMGDAPINAHFDKFVASLSHPNAPGARLEVENATDGPTASASAKPGDFSVSAGKVAMTGSAAQLEILLKGIETHIATLPAPIRNTFQTVRAYGPVMTAAASMTLTDTTMTSDSGKITVAGDAAASLVVPNVGTLSASAIKYHYTTTGTAGFDSLSVKLADTKSSEPVASLDVANAAGSLDGKTPLTVGTLKVTGDGKRLGAALHGAGIKQLPKQVADSISMVSSLNLDAEGLSIAKDPAAAGTPGAGGYDVATTRLTLTGDVNVTDKKGKQYHAQGASMTALNASTKLGADFKPREVIAGALDISGTFQSGADTMSGNLHLESAKLELDAAGNPTSVQASNVTANVAASQGSLGTTTIGGPAAKPAAGGATTTAPGAPSGGDVAGAFVPLVKDVDLHTRTPMAAGKWGVIDVMSGTMLDLYVQIRNQSIVMANTRVDIKPNLKLPLWFSAGGGYLKKNGSGFDVKIDTHGLLGYDVNATWVMRLLGKMGKEPLHLDLPTLYNQIMGPAHDSVAAAANEPPKKGKPASAGDGHGTADLFSLRGLLLPQTTGSIAMDIVNQTGADAVSGGVTIPRGKDTHISGDIDGGGNMMMSVDNLDITAGGNHVALQGFSAGAGVAQSTNMQTGTTTASLEVMRFGIQHVQWNEVPTGATPAAKPGK